MRRTLKLGLILIGVVALNGCEPSQAEVPEGRAISESTDDDPRHRRVWGEAGSYASPSPDGRLVAFVDWSTGDVAVHDIGEGESRRITDHGTWTENGSWAEWPVFSPDGEKVVYAYGNALTGDPYRYELRYVELGDTTQHLLRDIDVEEWWIAPLDWSERGILFVEYGTSEGSVLGILDPETAEVTVVDPEFGPSPGHARAARYSPDARYAVYEKDGLKVHDLEAGTVASINVPAKALIDWTADGRGIVVHSVLDGRAGLWLIPMADGRQAGQPRLLRGGIPSIREAGKRAGGAFYYSITVDAPKVNLASVDVQAGRLLSAPAPVTTALDGAARFPAWSPDGRQLAYLLVPLNGRGPTRLMVRDAEGEELRELASLTSDRVGPPIWSTDGSEILLLQEDLYAVSVADGDVRKVRSGVGRSVSRGAASLTPDGRTLMVAREERVGERTEWQVVAVELETGQSRILGRFEEWPRSLSVSPDGRRIAYVVRGAQGPSEIRIVSSEGGTARVVAQVDHPRHLDGGRHPLSWTADGEHLLVTAGTWGQEDSHDVWIVGVDDGTMRRIGMDGYGGSPDHSLSPGDDRLAFISGDERGELWVLDRLDR